MEILNYIKSLLLLNDCVVIPDFGGFVSNYKPAQVKHNRFMPPSKEIVFNPKLQKNDGLLINFISEEEGIGYFDAKIKVESFVEKSLIKLENYEKVVFEGLGVLFYNRMENLLFEPTNNENLLIDSFGLESFSYEKLHEKLISKPAVKIQNKDAVQIIFNKRNIKKALIGVPLVLALALIPLKNNKELLSHSDMNIFKHLTEVTAPVQEIKVKTVIEKEPEVVATPKKNNKYFVIGGSFREDDNARRFMKDMSQKGYHVENLGIFNGLHRISLQGFTDFQAAKNKINQIRTEDPSSRVWIHIKR